MQIVKKQNSLFAAILAKHKLNIYSYSEITTFSFNLVFTPFSRCNKNLEGFQFTSIFISLSKIASHLENVSNRSITTASWNTQFSHISFCIRRSFITSLYMYVTTFPHILCTLLNEELSVRFRIHIIPYYSRSQVYSFHIGTFKI